jgi:hypothetical protein
MIWRVILFWLLAASVVLAGVPRHQGHSNNLMGEVVAMSDPDMGVWTYQRDYAGRRAGGGLRPAPGASLPLVSWWMVSSIWRRRLDFSEASD